MRRDFMLAGLGIAASGCATPGLDLDVPYVSTPQPVVDAMLRLASVRQDDVVYDLGCGDGRIVITAARSAGVSGRVRFAVQNLFSTDFSEATVVMLYLLPELNAKLLPKIRTELKPGARVVSHQFRMGDWQPDRIENAWSGDRDHTLFLWVVPPR